MNTVGGSRIGYLIEVAILVLMAVGTIFVFSAGADVSTSYDLGEFYNFTTLKQLMFFPLAVIVMYSIAAMDYKRLSFSRAGIRKSITPYLLGIAIVLLVYVLLFGPERNESRRWVIINIAGYAVSFQPSELAKWSMISFLAAFLDYFAATIKRFRSRFIPVCAVAGVVIGLIVTQDFGTAAFIALLTFIMLLIGGACWWHFLVPAMAAAPVFFFAIYTSTTRMNRIKAFLHPDTVSGDATYQARESLIAISSGRTWGKGLGMGVSKYLHLPEDTTDFIFSIIAEELGFVGAMCVIAVFVAILILGMAVVIRCKDKFGKLLAAGIVLTFSIQAAINIGVVTVVLPTKGIPLPFISAGGTSMLLCAAAAGVLINIARQTCSAKEMRLQEVRSMTRNAEDETQLPSFHSSKKRSRRSTA